MLNEQHFETHSLTWSDIGGFLGKYRWLVLTVFLTGVLGTWACLQIFFTDQYESKASLIVKVGRETTEIPTTVQNGQVFSQGVRIQDINSEVQLLSSRLLVEQVVTEMGPDAFKFALKKPDSVFGYPKYYLKLTARQVKSYYKEFLIMASLKKRLNPLEEAITNVAESVKVEPVKESDVLVLKVRLPDAKLSQTVADKVVTHYMERRAEVRRNFSGLQFFESQQKEEGKSLAGLVAARANIRQKWSVTSPAEQRTMVLQRLAEIEREGAQNEIEIRKLERQRDVLKQQLRQTPDQVRKEQVSTQNPSLQSIRERITALQLERAKIGTRYTDDSQAVQKVETEIAELEARLRKEAPTVVASVTTETNPTVRLLQGEIDKHEVSIAGLVARNARLQAPAEQLKQELAMIDAGADRKEMLERELKIAEQNYQTYSKRREDARISEELDNKRAANVSLVSQPELPIEPVAPRKMFIMLIAIPVSLILGLALAALLESMDDKVRDAREVAAIGGMEYLGSLAVGGGN